MSSRAISDLCEAMRPKAMAFVAAMDKAGIPFITTCTRRSQAEQNALYAQGRTTPGQIVTWTLKSKHITGKAFDICIMVNGKPDWSMHKADLWKQACSIGVACGLSPGGLWPKNNDWPHFEA